MPEGHLVHRHARQLADAFAGTSVAASSPQGRFTEGAAAIDGATLTGAAAHGKRLFLTFDDVSRVLHVHLGRQGLWLWGAHDLPPRPSVRLRLAAGGTTADLIAPIVCELTGPDQRDAIVQELGPDPLRSDADAARARVAIQASRRPIGALLLDQSVIAGLGNVLRAEILNLVGVHPAIPGSSVTPEVFDALWTSATEVMRRAEDEGRMHHAPARRRRGRGARRDRRTLRLRAPDVRSMRNGSRTAHDRRTVDRRLSGVPTASTAERRSRAVNGPVGPPWAP